MATKVTFTLPDGRAVSIEDIIKSMESTTNSEVDDDDGSFMKKPVYGVESVSIDPKTMECDVKYSVEKFFGNKKDDSAPPAGKMRIKWLGVGTEVVFQDGSEAKNDVNDIFTSPYIKSKIQEFNDYYINQKGYQPFTQEDAKNLKTDVAQILREFFTLTWVNKVQIKFFNGTAIYGLFGYFLGPVLDKLFGSPGGAEGGPKALFISTLLNRGVPFCIVYTHTDEQGKKRVIVRRFLVVGIYSNNITAGHAKWG
jgi:hypothetical protein